MRRPFWEGARAMSNGAGPGDGGLARPLPDAVVGALLFFAALGIRAVAAARTAVIFNDGPVFLALAEQLRDGRAAEALAHDHHPLYPLLVRSADALVGDLERAAVLVSLVFGSGAVVALHALLVRAWDRRVALFGAAMLAVHPYAVRFSADVQSESVYLFFFLAGLAALFTALRTRAPRAAAVAGVLAGLAYLTRPEGIGIALVGGALAAGSWLRGSWSGRGAAAWLAALAAGAGSLVLPYLVLVRVGSGEWSLSRKKSLLALLGIDPSTLEAAQADLSPLVAAAILFGAAALAVAIAWSLGRLRGRGAARMRVGGAALASGFVLAFVVAAVGATDSMGVFVAALVSTVRPEVLMLVALGVAAGAQRRPTGRAMFVAAVVGLYGLVLFGLLVQYGYLSRRHVLPPVSVLLGYAGSGAVVLVDQVAGRLRARGASAMAARVAPAAALIALLAVVALPKAWDDHRSEQVAARLAAEWLAENPAKGGVLASNRQKHGWYAGLPWRPLWYLGKIRTLDILEYENVRWVLSERDTFDEDLVPLPPLRDHARLVLVERHRVEAEGRRAVVFELLER